MANQWFYQRGDDFIGPVDDRGLKNAVKAGDITPSSLISLGKEGAWGPASRIKGLFATAPPVPTTNAPPAAPPQRPPILAAANTQPISHTTAKPPVQQKTRRMPWLLLGLSATAGVALVTSAAVIVLYISAKPVALPQSPSTTIDPVKQFKAFVIYFEPQAYTVFPLKGGTPLAPLSFDVQKSDSLIPLCWSNRLTLSRGDDARLRGYHDS